MQSEEEKLKFGTEDQVRKIRLKLIQLIFDLVNNDDSIINDGFYVRETMGRDRNLMRRLL